MWLNAPPVTNEASAQGIDIGFANDQFTAYALTQKKPFYRSSPDIELRIKDKETMTKVVEEIRQLFRVKVTMVSVDENSYDQVQFMSDQTFVDLRTYYEKNYQIIVVSMDPELVDLVVGFARQYKEKSDRTKLKILVDDDGSIRFKDVANQSKAPERGNYTDEVLEELDHIVEDLNDSNPCGRIVLLDGPAGTGKTHMVRALPSLAPTACFVVIPASMIGQLAGPTFLALLTRNKPESGPLVLIIEDADEAIAERGKGNEAVLSTVLNMSDGILGAALDIRVVATTNAKLAELDDAVLRPGRLCRRIEIGALPAAKANEIYTRLKNEPGPFAEGRFVTLAEVYAEASGKKTSGKLKKATKAVGFGV